MTDALTRDGPVPEAANGAASVAARVAAPTLGPAERIEVMPSRDWRREYPPGLVAETMTGWRPMPVIVRWEGICASVLHQLQRRARMSV